ncbi:sensor histidine kinase [Cellulosimicrobium cellulans]|uniref:sensor histidine kinase n=1 Tax=Cellulosimicrobium cellulans TaxID=1710 RepID=UPI001D165579|nr:histidine kinase [Cellulosimicrobium cellulans]
MFAQRPAWRRVLRETGLLAAVALSGALLFLGNFALSVDTPGAQDDPVRFAALLFLDLAFGVAAWVVVLWRRSAPFLVALLLAVLAVVSTAAAPAALVAFGSLATRRRVRELAPVAAVWLVGVLAVTALGIDLVGVALPWWEVVAAVGATAVVLAVALAAGLAVGARRDLVATLHERVRLTTEEQRLGEERARHQERTQIAREMHDALAHRLSVTAMHASVLRHRTDLGAADRDEAVAALHDSSRQALADLRELLTYARGPSRSDDDQPQPTLDRLDELVAETPLARTDCAVDLERLPPTVSRHSFRIVQECLTNARRHAPGQRVDVAISGAPGRELAIVVRNPLAGPREGPPRPGLGVIGMQERARAVGGSVSVRPGDDEHVVSVTIPWPAA